MEEGVRRVLFIAAILLARSAGAAGQTSEGTSKALEELEKRFPPVKKNAAAEDLERLGLALGLDSHPKDPAADHPAKEDQDAYRQASAGAWLDAQVKTSDDSIAAPPARLNEFLQQRRAILQRIVGLLEKEVPEWGLDVHEAPRERADLLFVTNVGRILLSAALVEERAGRHAEAGELLEASWSLSRSLLAHPALIEQLIAVALGSRQAGVLRKMSEPGFEWVGRLAGESARKQMLEQSKIDPLMAQAQAGRESEFFELQRRMGNAFFDKAAEVFPCDLASLSYEEIWRSVDVATESPEAAELLRVIKEMAMPNLISGLYRAARLDLDRELTGRILSLRFERAASRGRSWPEKLFDRESRVCPGAGYDYQARSGGMLVRFQGSTRDPEAPAPFLPLSFEARVPRPTPTPTPSRAPRTATPPRPRS
jgi:hypothetical protein